MKYLKQKNLIIIIVSVIITLGVFFLVIKPTVIYIKNTKDQIRVEREELERRYQKIIYLRQNAEKLKEIERQLVVLDDLFLINGEEIKFVTTLEDVAEQSNVSQKINLKSVNLDDPKQKTLPFGISLSGKTGDIISYLSGVEQLPYYIDFNSLSIATKNTEEKLDVILNGEVYLLK